MFLEFARNRSNSADLAFAARLGWYGRSLVTYLLPGAAVGIGMLLVVGAGLLHRMLRGGHAQDPRLVLAVTYALVSLLALGGHEYLLVRNLVGPCVALLAATGLALAALPLWRARGAAWGVLLLVALSPLYFSGPYARDRVRDYYPERAAELDAVSAACAGAMALPGRTRVVGTFNEFSSGWVRILALDPGVAGPVTVSLPCPLPRSRAGYDPGWDAVYAATVARWTADGTARVVVLRVAADSPYRTRDYELWNAWKANLERALSESPGFQAVGQGQLPCGVGWTVFAGREAWSDPGAERLVRTTP